MKEILKQIRKLIVDGKLLEALNMIDDQIANASKKVERDADDSKTMENLRKMLEDECSRRCVLEKKLNLCIDAMQTVIDNTDEFATKELLMNILEKVKDVK